MTSIHHPGVSSEFPFASLLRSSDRELILVQLMTSVWETILQLPILPREGRSPVLRCEVCSHHAWTGAEALTEAEVRDGWREPVNMVDWNLKAQVPPVSPLGLSLLASVSGCG
jgi:hypothetical protein